VSRKHLKMVFGKVESAVLILLGVIAMNSVAVAGAGGLKYAKFNSCMQLGKYSEADCRKASGYSEAVANEAEKGSNAAAKQSDKNPGSGTNQAKDPSNVTPPAADTHSTVHAEAGAEAQEAARLEAARQARLAEEERQAKLLAEKKVREAESKARAAAAEAARRQRAEESAAAEHDRRLVERLKAQMKKDQSIPLNDAKSAKNEEVRDSLVLASLAKSSEGEISQEKKEASLNLAQLLQMAAITMQAATNLNSVEGTSPSQNLQTFDPTRPVAPKAALAGRSPASLGDKEGTISTQTDDPALAEGENGKKELSAKDKETLAKIKTEVEAAEKRKKIQAMRLKQKLREKANAQGKGAVDTDELFGGSLNQDIASAESDKTEETAAKESAMSASSVYQAVKEGFSLAGSETDREVGQIVSEAQRDLSSEEMSAGVLGRESPSLFARVHSVHQACQRQKCVLSLK
jgi:hypothetical protein